MSSSIEPGAVRKNEGELRALSAKWEQIGRVTKPRNGCDKEDAKRVHSCAGAIAPCCLYEAIARDPGYTSDRAQREWHDVEREDDADREVGPEMTEDVACATELTGNSVAKSRRLFARDLSVFNEAVKSGLQSRRVGRARPRVLDLLPERCRHRTPHAA
jgi:hypothetical protein